jgi:hypothetical protein
MDERKPDGTEWKWSYSIFFGIMYGPIPVGVIVVVLLAAIYFAVTMTR